MGKIVDLNERLSDSLTLAENEYRRDIMSL